MRNRISTILAFLAVSALAACGDESSSQSKPPGGGEETHDHEGAHGGELVELGDAAHLELVRKESSGEVTLYITGPNGKAPLSIPDAPEIKLATDAGQKVIATLPVNGVKGRASQFTAKDDALKSHEIKGRVSIQVGGKLFNPDIHEHHDQQHK